MSNPNGCGPGCSGNPGCGSVIEIGGDPLVLFREKSFDELYDLVMQRMEEKSQFSGIGYFGEGPAEDSYDTGTLIMAFDEAAGKSLAIYPDAGAVKGLGQKLQKLYEEAVKCEQYVESADKQAADIQEKQTLPVKYSMEINGCQLVLDGYGAPGHDVSIDEEIIKLYDISGTQDTSRLMEFTGSIGRLARGIGKTIRDNADDSTAWELDLYHSILHRLAEDNLNQWTDKLELDPHRYGLVDTIDTYKRMLWGCFNMIGGYLNRRYRQALSSKSRMTQRQVLEAHLKDPDIDKRLRETHRIKGRKALVPDVDVLGVDIYLLGIGIEKGRHYR